MTKNLLTYACTVLQSAWSMRKSNPNPHPIFKIYTLDHLAEVGGYSRATLRQVRAGSLPMTDRMRRMFTLALPEPEEALFASNGNGHDGREP